MQEFVTSDIGKLDTVLVQSPGPESRHVQLFAPHIALGGFPHDTIGDAAYEQHAEFIKALENSGARVLNARHLIDSAIQAAGRDHSLDFISGKFPALANTTLKPTSEMLIGADDSSFYPEDPGIDPFQSHPLQWMYYTRDYAVMLPDGVVLTSFDDESRSPETSIVRFMFENAPELQEYPVIFDAEEENVRMQGGDIIVLDATTLIMGIGNLTSSDAARALARATGMDVLGVRLPAGPMHEDPNMRGFTPLNLAFLHLDTAFNLVGDKKALVVPYYFQDEFGNGPLDAIFSSLSKNKLSDEDRVRLARLSEIMRGVGDVIVFTAGSGKQVPTGTKLVNYLEKRGFEFAFVGGAPRTNLREQVQHLTEVVSHEMRFQAANVIATEPGKVIMYRSDTSETQLALASLGVEVQLFDGHELARWNGGPHCMSMPIKRA